jgi:hypothetical protein
VTVPPREFLEVKSLLGSSWSDSSSSGVRGVIVSSGIVGVIVLPVNVPIQTAFACRL